MTRDDAVPSYASFVSRASNVLASYSPVTWEALDTATIHPIIMSSNLYGIRQVNGSTEGRYLLMD